MGKIPKDSTGRWYCGPLKWGKADGALPEWEHTLPRLSILFGAEFFLEFYGPAR